MFTKKDLFGLKFMILYTLLVIGLFAYAGVTGWKIFGSNTEKWEADGPSGQGHGHRYGRGYSGGSHYFHK